MASRTTEKLAELEQRIAALESKPARKRRPEPVETTLDPKPADDEKDGE